MKLSRRRLMNVVAVLVDGAPRSTLLNLFDVYWKLDEAIGDRAASLGGLTLTQGGSVPSDTGKQGLAATFAGSTNNRLTVAADAKLSVSATGFCVATWAKIGSKLTNRTILSKWSDVGAREYILDYGVTADRFRFYANDTSDTTRIATANTLGSPVLDTWYLIVAWFNPADNKLYISVNGGAADASVALTGGMKAAGASAFFVGAIHTGATSYTGAYSGSIDEIAIGNRPPTTDEITELYAEGSGTTYSFSGAGGPTIALPGVWTWFSDPRSLHYNGKTYIGNVDSAGDVNVRQYIHSTGALSASFLLKDALGQDDHGNPSFLIRDSDKKIMAFYSGHNDDDTFMRISTNAEDATAWDAEVGLDATLNLSNYTYSHPYQLLGEANDPIYLIFRADVDISNSSVWCYTKSVDGGATWSTPVQIFNQTFAYNKSVKNGEDRIDFAVNTTHPDIGVNALYHCYYQGGNWYKTDGTLITETPPFDVTAGSLIYDAVANDNVRCWIWDIAIDSSGYPAIVYAIFPDAETDHRYRYARWDGNQWNDYPLCNGGAQVYAGEPHYSGGVCLDHSNPNIVYAAREVGGAVYQIYKMTTADGGQTFTSQQMTSRSQECLRPFVVPGYSDTKKLMYFTGLYNAFSDYKTVTILDNG